MPAATITRDHGLGPEPFVDEACPLSAHGRLDRLEDNNTALPASAKVAPHPAVAYAHLDRLEADRYHHAKH
jgi:hypothetical protein